MPNIQHFRQRKILKDIIELCDQEDFVTYTYLENLSPAVVPGKTALGGKLTYLGVSVGYGIPYATQFTNPSKIERYSYSSNYSWHVVPQADPDGLFKPASADGTWVLLKDPSGKDVKPVFIEPKIITSPFKFPSD